MPVYIKDGTLHVDCGVDTETLILSREAKVDGETIILEATDCGTAEESETKTSEVH